MGGTSGQPRSGQPGCNHEFAADLLIRSMCFFCSATCFPNLISSSLTCLFPVQRMHLFQHEKAVVPKSGADYTKADPTGRFGKHPLANQSTDSCPHGWGCLLPLCAQPDGHRHSAPRIITSRRPDPRQGLHPVDTADFDSRFPLSACQGVPSHCFGWGAPAWDFWLHKPYKKRCTDILLLPRKGKESSSRISEDLSLVV